MDSKSTTFLIVMAAIIVAAVLVWLVYLVVGRRAAAGSGTIRPAGTRWYEYLLAGALLIGLIVVAVLLLFWGLSGMPDGAGENWRSAGKTTVFIVILAAVAALVLLAFVIALFRKLPGRSANAAGSGALGDASASATYQTPAATRLLGPLLFVLALLLTGWLYLTPPQQYQLMLQLVYPASLAVALVLLFDKATRSWSPKSAWAGLREWLYCDAITFLLLLGFVNLLRSGNAGSYTTLFWDVLHIILFFFVFWLLDRKLTRYRFLVAQGYLILLPLLLLLWRSAQLAAAGGEGADAAVVEAVSWWGSVWPFLFLALIAFVLEIIALIASRNAETHPIPAFKDIIFFVLYAILLISAIPPAAEMAQ